MSINGNIMRTRPGKSAGIRVLAFWSENEARIGGHNLSVWYMHINGGGGDPTRRDFSDPKRFEPYRLPESLGAQRGHGSSYAAINPAQYTMVLSGPDWCVPSVDSWH